MSFQLNATRVLYQTSRYAPVAVIQLELVAPAEESFGLSKTQIDRGFYQLSAGGCSGPLSLSGEGTSIEMYCNLVLELQRYAGHSVSYSRVQVSEKNYNYRVFIEYEDAATALYAGELAADLLNALLEKQDSGDLDSMYTLHQELDDYVDFALSRCLDPNMRLLIQSAIRQGIPVLKPERPWHVPTLPQATKKSGKVQFGWGVNQRCCEASMMLGFTPRENLAQITDRAQLLLRLKNASIPLAGQDLEFINRNPVRRAQRSARRIGYPVKLRPRVTKPAQYRSEENHSFGPLHSDTDVMLVTSYLREQAGVDVWVESWREGTSYRFLILNNEMLCVVRCTPPVLTGDGIHNIAELAGRRAAAAPDSALHRAWYRVAQGDTGVSCRLRLAGLNMESILAPGERITIRGSGTIYNGGLCEDVTNEMPPRFGELALEVAEIAEIRHLAGVEMNIADLSGPAAMPNCAVSGVDPAPDLQEHGLSPEEGPHQVGKKYMALLFPANRPPRIPTVAVTGTNGKTTTSRMVNQILCVADLKTGLTCTDGIYVKDKLLRAGDMSGVQAAVVLLMQSGEFPLTTAM